ncbi:acyltransferase domain-containing protein [Streptomyces yokosukanensis]|uniref:type I polyketide synthase n=1 Tax=Streptomyces yokosukanensis TaxID=67386 RepID=UPI00341F8E16
MSPAQKNSDAAPRRPSADAIGRQLREAVAGLLTVPPDAVPVDRPLSELGLEPEQLTALVGRLSGWLRRPVPAWTVWQYPTPAALAAHLAGDERAARAAAATPAGGRAGAHAPVAIVGMGCRLPGGVETPEALWQSLLDGVEGVGEVGEAPGGRGGFLDDAAGFDADLLRITPAEARQLDPRRRIALETAWAALEDARIVHDKLPGNRTGMFMGTGAQDHHPATGARTADSCGPCAADGWGDAAGRGRIARALGLDGPALAVATACGSALAAAHLAVRSLRDGQVDLALAGGVHVRPGPHTPTSTEHLDGEGCGVLVLRRLSDALAAGDRVYAVIRGSAAHHDGVADRDGVADHDGADDRMAPPAPGARADVLRAAWQDAGISPRHVSYVCVEAHGAGTPLGERAEAEALGTVFAGGRAEALRVGSAGTGLCHPQAAAGAVGLMKTALALHHGEIPAGLRPTTPGPFTDGAVDRLEVVTERTPWPGTGRRYAGVSGFGRGGADAHLALEEAPHRRRLLVPLAADNAGDLCTAADVLTDRVRTGGSWYAPEVLGRAAGTHRVVAAVDHPGDLAGALGARIAARSQGPAARPDALAFCFSGPGSQWLGMGRDLLGDPAFRTAFEACDRALEPFTGWSVTEELLADPAASRLERSDVVQPVLFALQTALARTLSAWGVEPTVVFGQSVGEVAAAVFAGALPLDEGARLITTWSRLVAERAAGHGALTVCELSLEDAESLPQVRAGRLSLAGHLAPGQVCLSGPREAVETLERDLDVRGVRAVRVNIDHAAHSARIARLTPELEQRLGALRTRTTTVPFWSTVLGGYADGTDLDAAYWGRAMCTPMRLAEATRALADGRGVRVVEITPHPVASHALQRSLDAVDGDQPRTLSTGRRGQSARQALEDLAAALWCDGSDVDWGAVTGRRRRRARPTPVALTVSGRTARARAENAARLAGLLDGTPDTALVDVAYTAARHRPHLEHRASVVAASSAEAAEALRALADDRPHPGLVEGAAATGTDLAVLFTGQGSERIGMGREWYAAFPAFRRALDEVCAALDPHLRLPLAAVLFAAQDGPDAALIHEAEFSQPGLFALEVALFRLWQSWGVTPAAVAGHSVGEIAAAHVAGVLDLADAARLVAARGRLLQACEPGGATACVRAGEAETAEVPAHTSPSPHREALSGEFGRVAAECVFREPSLAWVSTVTGGLMSADQVSDPGHWVRHTRAPVRFADAVRTLESRGVGRYVECGPAGVLSALGASCVAEPAVFVASHRGADEPGGEVRSLVRALGALHVAGQDISWQRVFAGGVPVDLPIYAFQRGSEALRPARGLAAVSESR